MSLQTHLGVHLVIDKFVHLVSDTSPLQQILSNWEITLFQDYSIFTYLQVLMVKVHNYVLNILI